jgi:hypothetical protein
VTPLLASTIRAATPSDDSPPGSNPSGFPRFRDHQPARVKFCSTFVRNSFRHRVAAAKSDRLTRPPCGNPARVDHRPERHHSLS